MFLAKGGGAKEQGQAADKMMEGKYGCILHNNMHLHPRTPGTLPLPLTLGLGGAVRGQGWLLLTGGVPVSLLLHTGPQRLPSSVQAMRHGALLGLEHEAAAAIQVYAAGSDGAVGLVVSAVALEAVRADAAWAGSGRGTPSTSQNSDMNG